MKNKSLPLRRCLGCAESKPKDELIRIALSDGRLVPDLQGVLPGRGCYLCKEAGRITECFAKAVKRRAFERTLRKTVTGAQIDELREVLIGNAR